MPGANLIVDEFDSGRTAKVSSDRSVSVQGRYFSYLVTSATGTAAIFSGPGVLHSVNMGASAAGAILALFDSSVASAIGSDQSIAEIQLGTQQPTRLYDVVFNTGLTYRLSAIACPGVVITYSKGS